MPDLNRISSGEFISKKKYHKKVSFNVGDKFVAKVAKIDYNQKSIILKTLDGWEFEAELEQGFDLLDLENKLKKFFVKGFEGGKLKVAFLEAQSKSYSLEESLNNVISKYNIKDEETKNLLRMMLKFDLPINKENITKIKSMLEFQNKLSSSEYDLDKLIKNIFSKHNIDIGSEKGREISGELNKFFEQFKSVDLSVILTMEENNIEYTRGNLKSLINLNTDKVNISDIIKNIEDIFKENSIRINDNNNSQGKEDGFIQIKEHNNMNLMNSKDKDAIMRYTNTYNTDEILNKFLEKIGSNDSSTNKIIDSSNKEIMQSTTQTTVDENGELGEKKATVLNESSLETKVEGNIDINLKNAVKLKVKENIQELKNVVETLVQNKETLSEEVMEKISTVVNKHMDDIKVFNSISDNYYYLDSPIEMFNERYPCKLIIKDNRENGKKIDSRNIKIAISLKTLRMGEIDSFIKVNNKSMNIDVCCEEKWMNIFNNTKGKLIERISKEDYFVTINIRKKEKEFGIIECREFFEENNIGAINTRV